MFDELVELRALCDKTSDMKIDLTPILNMHHHAHELVAKSYLERNEVDVTQVISIKEKLFASDEAGEELHMRGATYEARKNELARNLIDVGVKAKLDAPNTRREFFEAYSSVQRILWHLESKVSAMIGDASNISEAWFFMLERS